MYLAIIWQISRNYLLKNIVEIYWYHNELLICFPKEAKVEKEKGGKVFQVQVQNLHI